MATECRRKQKSNKRLVRLFVALLVVTAIGFAAGMTIGKITTAEIENLIESAVLQLKQMEK